MNASKQMADLHDTLKMKKLNPIWAKAEIILGLAAATAGFLISVRMLLSGSEISEWTFVFGGSAMMILGLYLAMAGHRSHIYQSNNRLTAYLAECIKREPHG